jgi:hypothetical protein
MLYYVERYPLAKDALGQGYKIYIFPGHERHIQPSIGHMIDGILL